MSDAMEESRMPGGGPAVDRVWVALHEKTALIRVQGRGSFKVSTALKQFSATALASGCTTAVLDMADCVGMDSTFMGVLAGFAARLRSQATGLMVMLNLSSRTRGLVATLGLDLIVEAYQTQDTPERFKPYLDLTSRMTELAMAPAGKAAQQTTAETMLEAHESLVALAADNLPRFKDVLSFLREDIQRGRNEPAAP
jgi:anti-anti-sigma regulatory factor